jgi:nicotinate-nucleotide adenylyltransferase
MRIGFLMGSFDPIHIGHINMVREAMNFVDKVILVVSGHNPWKKHNPAPFELRFLMCVRAVKPFGDVVEVSGIESTFEPPYYANKPLNYFRDKYKDDEKYIICGSDTAEKIPLWKEAVTDILPYYKILSLDRDEKGTHRTGKDWKIRKVTGPDGKEYEYKHVFINPFPVSSTLIRQLIKDNGLTYPLLPIEVSDVIKEHSLYMD